MFNDWAFFNKVFSISYNIYQWQVKGQRYKKGLNSDGHVCEKTKKSNLKGKKKTT